MINPVNSIQINIKFTFTVCEYIVVFEYILLTNLRVCLAAEGAKNVFWHWLSPLHGWGSLTMALTGKFVYMAHHFILLWLNPFDLRVDRERMVV